ncbi:MAG TPA: zf-HC2 domain-containing protein [Pyrinomonadaceae bacterium]|nr:zf-HC2 domain-containing protein [Pyrinomonadaceae bacterium]
MTDGANDTRGRCPQAMLTAAYLDGELDARAAEDFELHTAECAVCAGALLEQRRLLCLLDTAFDETFEKRVALPEGFTRELRARAQNDMRGVRDAGERRRALKICLALGAAAFALLGFAAFDAVLAPVLSAARTAGGMLSVTGHAAADAGAGTGFVLRAVGGRLVAGTELPAALQWAVLAVAVVFLLRLISAYHRRAGARD